MPRFEYETLLDCPPAAIFNFLLRPANVARMADPSTGLTIVSGPEIVTVGSQIAFQLIVMGRVQSAVHEITEVVHHQRVVETQIQGPLKSWTQQHLYEPTKAGVRMIDIIDFEPPGGILGFIATPERISSSLEEGYFARQQRLERLVSAGELPHV